MKPCIISLIQRLYSSDILRMSPDGYFGINTSSTTGEQNLGINFNYYYYIGNIKPCCIQQWDILIMKLF